MFGVWSWVFRIGVGRLGLGVGVLGLGVGGWGLERTFVAPGRWGCGVRKLPTTHIPSACISVQGLEFRVEGLGFGKLGQTLIPSASVCASAREPSSLAL